MFTRIYDDRGVILQSPDPVNPGDHPLPPGLVTPANFRLELRAFPGSPFAHAMALDTVFTPDTRNESAFQIQLIQRAASGRETVLDAGSFTAAPILFLDNGVRPVRFYICDTPDTQAAVTDVRAALSGVGGIQLVTVPADVANGDTWLQDQFQPGIAVGSDGWRHVIVHMPRMRSNFYGAQSTSNLASFVTSHFPSPNVCLIDDFWKRELKFTDATGTRVTLSFRDCIRLSNLMSRLPALVRNLDDTSAMIDENFQAHWLTWPDMRAQLPNIVDQFVQRAKNAMRKERAAWKLTLQD